MDKLRPMPEHEKFRHAFEMVCLYHKHVLPFVEESLGYAEMHNLRSVWQAAIIPIHDNDPDKDKYDQAYSNWLWMARCSHDLLTERLSGEQVTDYKRLILRLHEQQHDNPELIIFRTLKAHCALAKALLYKMQWLTPMEVARYGNREITCVIHDCKLLQTVGSKRVCRIDCQYVGTATASKAYHLKRVTYPTYRGCTIILTPLGA